MWHLYGRELADADGRTMAVFFDIIITQLNNAPYTAT